MRRHDGSETTTFGYNGDGVRDSLTYDSDTTTFTWDVNRAIPQILDDGSFEYVYGVGRIAQVESDGTTHYYLADGLGSTMALTDALGDVVNEYEYDVFGALRSSSTSQPNISSLLASSSRRGSSRSKPARPYRWTPSSPRPT